MKTPVFLLLIFFILSSHDGSSQPTKYELVTHRCLLGCGAEFNYNSKIVIFGDTISILQLTGDTETLASQYLIFQKKEKWKTLHYHGTSLYKVIQMSDHSKRDIQIVLRQGKGKIKIFNNGECQITISVETSKKTVANKIYNRWRGLA